MTITREEAVKVWQEFGLYDFPRRVGIRQEYCPGPDYFFAWLDSVNGKQPVFVSHNAMLPKGPGAWQIKMTKTFADLDPDGGATPDEVWEDVCHLSEFLVKERISHGWVYSGNPLGAFHCYVFPEPYTEGLNETRSHAVLAKEYQGFWRGMTHQLRLRSIALQCLDPPRLLRLPFSRYVQKIGKNGSTEYKLYPNYCVPVPWDWIGKYDLKAIQTLSRHPVVFPSYIFNASRRKLGEMIESHQWQRFGPDKTALHPMPTTKFVGKAKDLFDYYEPNRLCLRELLFETNPSHTVRFAACAQMVMLGMGEEEAVDFFDGVAEEAKWVDRANIDIRRGQVRHICGHKYQVPSCVTLRQRGVCLGAACPLFAKYWPEEAKAEARVEPPTETVSAESWTEG